MKCHKCNCEATEDNWVGGFNPEKATCERCHYSSYDIPNISYNTNLVIRIKTKDFNYCDGELTIAVKDYEEILLVPNGTYQGFNWFKSFSLGVLKDLVLEKFKKEK